LIGINGSGKSNLFKASRFFRYGIFGMGAERYILEVLGGIDSALFMGVGINSFSLELVLDGPKLTVLAGGFPLQRMFYLMLFVQNSQVEITFTYPKVLKL